MLASRRNLLIAFLAKIDQEIAAVYEVGNDYRLKMDELFEVCMTNEELRQLRDEIETLLDMEPAQE